MALLAVFAFIAGAGTALSPCVLPILPAVLSAGVSGGRRRPLGVVVGLALTFAFAIVGLVYVIDALGLPDDIVRTAAIIVLLGFGITLLIPPLADRLEAAISRLVPALENRRGDGFRTGLLVGASLGIVYVPCAGPILAGVTTASAAQDFTAGKLVVALAYAAGSAVVIYALIIGGRKLVDRLKPIQSRIQVGLGAVMVAVAFAMLADLDLRFQRSIAENLPAFLRNPATPLEESGLVSDEISEVSGRNPHAAALEGGGIEADEGLRLPVLGAAPEIVPGGEWFNTEPFTLAEQSEADRVTLVDFWTYTCINCIRTLPYLRAWHEEYADEGLTILGVHTPEFAFEREAGNVENAIGEYDIAYPVMQDNEFATWDAFGNQYWPAKYLIDADGDVRYVHFGEGEYETTERAIRALLGEAGSGGLGPRTETTAESADPAAITPETYFGSLRATGFVNGAIVPGIHDYGPSRAGALGLNQFAYAGAWKITGEHASAVEDASVSLRFQARRVFCVMGAPSPAGVRVLLDGEPIPGDLAGEDVKAGTTEVSGQRLYRLVELPQAGAHTLTLKFDPEVSGYAFTFG